MPADVPIDYEPRHGGSRWREAIYAVVATLLTSAVAGVLMLLLIVAALAFSVDRNVSVTVVNHRVVPVDVVVRDWSGHAVASVSDVRPGAAATAAGQFKAEGGASAVISGGETWRIGVFLTDDGPYRLTLTPDEVGMMLGSSSPANGTGGRRLGPRDRVR